MCKRVVFASLFSLLMTAACSRQTQQDGLLIAVSIPPQAWFVSQIAGDNVRVLILAGSGQNPHNFEPAPKQIQALSCAGAWILSGVEFEVSLLPKIISVFPDLLVVDGTQGVKFRTLEEHDFDDDHNDRDHHNSSLEVDRHTWLGREPAKILAAHVRDTLSLLDSENQMYYREQYEKLTSLIDDEFDMLSAALAPLSDNRVFVYHPSFGYFLDEFGIRQAAVETGGKEPTPRELYNLVAGLKKEKAAAIFVQAQFPVNAARTLAAAVDAELINLDPLAQDWLENIRLMGAVLKMSMLRSTP
ncbi:MAG: zinc ABC transporter substrate-binding protein [Treponema sp.]|jgi:zinc transport system substrate-binding protein|nr:zinc ABC transporter substrate-binding protein [Treponema sp.]